jgi:flagellar P-ring protein FlgI
VHAMQYKTTLLAAALALIAALGADAARAELRVQDIARLQGQRTNKIMGYGLVIGLSGTGDGGKNEHTMRALMAMHRKFHEPVISPEELKSANNVALVVVEATIPEYGAREGQTIDVAVSTISAKSIKGGRLLTTPLQYAALDEKDPATQQILALAGGWIDIPNADVPTRGIVHGGCTLEADFFYNFILDGAIMLVLDDEHAGYTWANLVARSVNDQTVNLAALEAGAGGAAGGRALVPNGETATALGPKNVVVRIPACELPNPANFISRVMESVILSTPEQPARVCINRTTGHISFTGTVTVSPTILQVPSLGTISVGGSADGKAAPAGSAAAGKNVQFQDLLGTLSKLQLTPEQTIAAIEHLYRTGTLHALLVYTE